MSKLIKFAQQIQHWSQLAVRSWQFAVYRTQQQKQQQRGKLAN